MYSLQNTVNLIHAGVRNPHFVIHTPQFQTAPLHACKMAALRRQSSRRKQGKFWVVDKIDGWPRSLTNIEAQHATLLMRAVEAGDVSGVKKIVSNSKLDFLVNVRKVSKDSEFPLFMAAGFGDLDMVTQLFVFSPLNITFT